MGRPSAPFNIHVDPSCLTSDSPSVSAMGPPPSPERVVSDETVVHRRSWEASSAGSTKEVSANGRRSLGNVDKQLEMLEAKIHQAAKEVVQSMELTHAYTAADTEVSYEDEADMTYSGSDVSARSGPQHSEDDEANWHEDDDQEGHDDVDHHGDIDSDAYTQGSQSHRSSFGGQDAECNSRLSDLHSPVLGEDADTSSQDVSRMPSICSSISARDFTPHTPTRSQRVPFRSPSSVRAIQMASPAASLYNSPYATKRLPPSRSSTPNGSLRTPGASPSKKTPTRMRIKKEYPLVLLHVTMLPLSWPDGDIMHAPDLPESLQQLGSTWRFLQEKISDTVYERGVLIPHPQDSYELLEERLLEALGLPVRPRARILKCGHYMGPDVCSESESDADSGIGSTGTGASEARRWCDVCGKEVRYEYIEENTGIGRPRGRPFVIKVYASNGLMRAGAWAACWREMERVDVEIEPCLSDEVSRELNAFAEALQMAEEDARRLSHPDLEPASNMQRLEDAYHGTAAYAEDHHDAAQAQAHALADIDYDAVPREGPAAERLREIYGTHVPPPLLRTEPPEAGDRRHSFAPRTSESTRRTASNDSLLDLLLRSVQVAMRDRRNVAIGVLSVLVLLLAFGAGRGGGGAAGGASPGEAGDLAPLLRVNDSSDGLNDVGILPSVESVSQSVSAGLGELGRKAGSVLEDTLSSGLEVVEDTFHKGTVEGDGGSEQ